MSQTPFERGEFGDKDLPWIRNQLLALVNQERNAAGRPALLLDELAGRVAGEHSRDMVQGEFLSHWGTDGRKPYQRYSFAGGSDAMQENVSAADDIPSVTSLHVAADLNEMHTRMHDEAPPADGHRRAMLAPQNTHVGFGIALKNHSLRLTEIYLARYLAIDPFPQQAKLKTTIALTGRLLHEGHFLHEVDVFYEGLPVAPDLTWLREPRAYTLPDKYLALRPKAPGGGHYQDGTSGDYNWSRDGKFRAPVSFMNDSPGIYTIVFWIRREPAEKAFQAAQICIRCE
jgi:Cysteine-rich secretory protein family